MKLDDDDDNNNDNDDDGNSSIIRSMAGEQTQQQNPTTTSYNAAVGEENPHGNTGVENLYPPGEEKPSSAIQKASGRVAAFVNYGKEYDSNILKLALPSYGTMLLDPMATLVDSAMCGRLGAAALGGIGAANPLCSYISWMFFFLSVTTTSGVTSMIASDNRTGARKKIALATWVALAIGVLAGSIMFTIAPKIMSVIVRNPDVVPHSIEFLQSRALGAPATLTFFVASGALRGFQDMKTPFYASIAANMINLALGAVLMFVFKMGVFGAGLATSVSQYVSAAVLYFFLFKQDRLRWSDFNPFPNRAEIKQVLKPGATLILRKVLENLSFAMTISYITSLGTTTLAAQEIARSVWISSGVAWWPLCVTLLALCSKLVAEKKFEAGHTVAQRIMRMGMLASFAVSAFVIGLSNWIPMLFSADSMLRAAASQALICAACTYPFAAIVDMSENISMAYADYKFSTYVMLAGFAVLTIALQVVKKLRLGLPYVWMIYNLFFLTRAVLNLYRIGHRKRKEEEEASAKSDEDSQVSSLVPSSATLG